MISNFLQKIFALPPYSMDIRHKILHLLNANFIKSTPIIILNSGFLLYILWDTESHTLLTLWFVIALLITLARDLLSYYYFKRITTHNYETWYHYYTIGVLFSTSTWAAVPILFFAPEQIVHNFFIAFVILGVASGSTATLAGDLKLSRIYLFFLLVPMLFQFWTHNDPLYLTAGFMTIFYLLLVSVTGKSFHKHIINSLRNQELYNSVQNQLDEHEKQLSMMFKQAPIGIFYYDNNLTIIDCNTKLEEVMHAPREKLIGLNLNMLPDRRPVEMMKDAVERMEATVYEGPYHTKIAGLDLIVKIQMTPLIDQNGVVHGGLSMMEDKTKEYQARQEAEFLSLHDPLTGLPNRKLLKERMKQTLAEQEREQTHSALLFLDLDHFKQINDSLGHNMGDQMLIQTSERLKQTLRRSDTLSRLGGDEFVILLPHVSTDKKQTYHHAYDVAQKIHDAMSEPFNIGQQQLFSSTSIGISLFDATLTESNEILRRADMAMYQSKSDGRKRTSFYNTIMDHEMQHYVEMKKNLSQAIKKGEFSLFYQPILSIKDDTIISAEALLRWEHNGKFISTIELIKVAEESSLINEIGYWVIEQACQQIERWKEASCFSFKYITVNISARQLLEKGFSDFVTTMIKQYHLDHKEIKLEITETALITDFNRAKEVIDALNTLGIDFIIDDFGTGYSSLSYLKLLPLSALKIDRSFVKDILVSKQDEKLIRAIINTAQQFNYDIIAEGIEEEAQKELLNSIDSSLYYQGFLTTKPLNAEAFITYIKSH